MGSPGAPGSASRNSVIDDWRADDLAIEKKWLQLARIDSEKFTFFFDKYHDRILAYAYWRTGDEDLAADIANTVFATAWKKLDRFRWQGYSFGAWLFRLAWGEINNALRYRGNRREVEFKPGFNFPANDDSPDRILARQEDHELIRICLNQLDDIRHEVFVLYYWIGMSTAQVATVLDMPQGTVTSHLKRGRQQLLAILHNLGYERNLSPSTMQVLKNQVLEDSGLRLVEGKEPAQND